MEILIRFAPTEATKVGAAVRCSPEGEERVEIAYDRTTKRLGDAPVELGADEELALRIYVDRSVIEAFANGRACQTLRFYPQRDDCVGVGLFARDGKAKVNSVDVWKIPAAKGV